LKVGGDMLLDAKNDVILSGSPTRNRTAARTAAAAVVSA